MKRVLAVDDDARLVSSIQNALQGRGYAVCGAGSVEEGFERAKKMKPACVLLDILLPDGGGFALARQFRRDPDLYRTPITYMSAVRDEPEVQHALTQGGDSYLTKPFSLEQLLNKIRALEALALKAAWMDPVTGLPGLESITRRIDHLIFRAEPFSACYFSVDGFSGHTMKKKPELARSLLAWVGHRLAALAEEIGTCKEDLAHLGRDHFMAVLPPGDCERFCSTLTAHFGREAEALCNRLRIESERGKLEASKRRGASTQLSLRIDVACSSDRAFRNAHAMLRELATAHKLDKGECRDTLFRYKAGAHWPPNAGLANCGRSL